MNIEKRYSTADLEKFIKSLYARIEPIARKDGVYKPLDDYFGLGTPNNIDGSFCYSDINGYHYCVIEYGRLITNELTQSLFEISYLVISNYIFWMAVNFERKNRIKGQDSRRMLFKKELQYWGFIGENYQKRAQQKIEESLEQAPYIDCL